MADSPEWTQRQSKEAPLKVLFNVVETSATSRLVKESFHLQDDARIIETRSIIEPSAVEGYTQLTPQDGDAYQEERQRLFKEHLSPTYDKQRIAPEWEREDFKAEMKRMIKEAVAKVSDSDVVVLTGGRDYGPLLLGNPRHPETQRYSIFDIRDVVESYMLLTAIAQGKTIHSTCRGFQVTAGVMMKIFADNPVAIHQHIPEFLEQHAIDGESHHHYSHDLQRGLDSLIAEGDEWEKKVLLAQRHRQSPHITEVKDAAHDVKVIRKGLLHDALNLAKQISPQNPITVSDTEDHADMASIHHQGFIFKSLDEPSKEIMMKALEQAGGLVVAHSDDERDKGVDVVEGIKFSKVIDEKALEKIKTQLAEWNDMLGLDIEIPLPKLSEGKPLPRCDIPHATQCHPEVNIAGAAMVIPALTLAFARAKKQAMHEGKDLGDYDAWRENVNLKETLGHSLGTNL